MEKHNGKRRYYFGIDLGTTNSVVAWANIEEQEGEFIEPKVVNIRMPDRINDEATDDGDYRLPSCVYFRDNPPQKIVGKFAKGMLLARPEQVEKSIKTKMGTSYTKFGCDPEKISKYILETLYDGIYVPGFPKDEFLKEVVIGIPASFEPRMSDATLKAAKLAGFQESILIHEPIAAIYDYKNQLNRGLLPDWALGIEFRVNDPQLILVFDLGGGTLDVTLHKVSLCDNQKLSVDEVAVSRYTDIGGDNFDEKLAEHFLCIRKKKNPTFSINDSIERQYQEYAEQAKIYLSEEIYAQQTAGAFDPKKCKIEFRSQGRDGRPDDVCVPPDYDLTVCEYEKIVAPLLANHLTLDDIATFCSSTSFKNIIDPILQVLQDGQSALNSETPIIPDAVLLSGAMTRLHTIQERLKTFFPDEVTISPIVDPDRAVARGAVIAHYNRYNS